MPAGRPRKPTATKILEGDQPCRINRNEPRPPDGGVGPCPDELDPIARRVWGRLAAILEAMGVLTSADADGLEIYCSNASLRLKALAEITRDGMTVPTQFSFKPHPMLSVVARCEATMGRILAQYGMTPSARAALNLGNSDEDDEFDKWVKEGQSATNGPKKAPNQAHPGRTPAVDQDQ